MKKIFLAVLLIMGIILTLKITGMAENNQPETGGIEIVDVLGETVTLSEPAARIISVSPAFNEIMATLGAVDRLVAVDSRSSFPDVFGDLPTVGSASNHLQLEKVVELQPDLVIVDTRVADDTLEKLAAFGIPVVVERGSDQERFLTIINNFAKLTDTVERGNELIEFIESYQELITSRLSELDDSAKTRVYWEWRGAYQTGNSAASVQPRIEMAGGENIAYDLEATYPVISAEYIIEADPEVIIRMASRNDSKEDMAKARQDLMSREVLDQLEAVQKDRVYIISWDIHNGPRSIIGSLYYAKWFHPELFADLDPAEVDREMLARFYDIENGVDPVVYPLE